MATLFDGTTTRFILFNMKEAEKISKYGTGVTGSCCWCLLQQSAADNDGRARYLKPLHAMKVEFRPENSVNNRYYYTWFMHTEKYRRWQLTAAGWTEAGHRHHGKAQFCFCFWRSEIYLLGNIGQFFSFFSGNKVCLFANIIWFLCLLTWLT